MTRGSPAVNVTTVSEGGGPDVSSTMASARGIVRVSAAGVLSLPRRRARSAAGGDRETEPACSSPEPPEYSGHRLPGGERFTVRVLRCLRAIGVLLPACAPPLAAQGWDAPEAVALVRRAVDQRVAVQADSMLLSYRTRAHGFVFFLAQVGEGLTEPPRLVKADELDVEVYWQAPNHSKQVVLGWRDGAFLPTDIEYHRDHLGIVTNNFGDVIRIGEGDEVRDAIHPLSRAGLALYRLRARRLAHHPHRRRRGHRARGAGPAPLLRASPHRGDDVHRHRDRRAGPLPLQLHPVGVPRPAARGHHHRAGERPLRGALVASVPAGDRDPASGQLPRLSGARHHPGPLGDRGLRPERGDSAGGAGRPGHRRTGATPARRLGLGPAALGRDRGCRRADQPTGHGRAPGRGRANRRRSGPGRSSLDPARDRLAERPRSGEPGAGPRARLRWHDRHRGAGSVSGRGSATAPRTSASPAASRCSPGRAPLSSPSAPSGRSATSPTSR